MNLADHLPALQVIVPLMTAPLVILLRNGFLAWLGALLASLASFGLAILLTVAVLGAGVPEYAMGGWQPPFGISLNVDGLSALMLLLVTGASTLGLAGGRLSLRRDIDNRRAPMFYGAWLIALAGLCGIAVAGDAFNVFVFMEISSLATYILIAAGRDRRALSAVFKYLIIGTIGATFYLIGVGFIYMMTGTLNFADMALRLGDVIETRPIIIAAGFITIGLALKAAVFPLHIWLPRAYTYAPNAVTVFIAACSTKVAIYVLLRFNYGVFHGNLLAHSDLFTVFIIPLALSGILLASAIAIYQGNIKKMLAFSSVAQIGYIALAAGLATHAGLMAAQLHMFNHALAKGTLFLCVLAFVLTTGSASFSNLAGIGRRMPWTMAAFVIAGLSLVGVPGTAGFVSKWYLIVAVMGMPGWGVPLVMAIILSSLLAVVYLWRFVELAYYGQPPDGDVSRMEVPLPLRTLIWSAALANIYFGLVPQLPLALAESGTTTLLGGLLP
ncbi:MAG: monovalent cation/H+ antiporter subunit D family protein [Haliea sp.]|jgi:multicomponent Na+:H+ antiporter subunit D|nr:monovalent cation/H+ antiporter subunit D family protein [Haliea sp.]